MNVEKVVQVYSSERDQLASSLADLFERWWTAKDTLTSRWNAVEAMVFGITAGDTIGYHPAKDWQSNITTGKIAQIADALIANYETALLSDDEWMDWEVGGEVKNPMQTREKILAYMRNILRKGGIRLYHSRRYNRIPPC